MSIQPSGVLAAILVELSSSRGVHNDETNKELLLTLHALFPTTLLPALDLLDRKLVTCLILDEVNGDPIDSVQGDQPQMTEQRINDEVKAEIRLDAKVRPPSSPFNDPQEPDANTPTAQPSRKRKRSLPDGPYTYYVYSQHPPPSRTFSSASNSISRPRSSSSSAGHEFLTNAKSYEVRPLAWSCTCAAFAFACFNSSRGSNLRFGDKERERRPWDGFADINTGRPDAEGSGIGLAIDRPDLFSGARYRDDDAASETDEHEGLDVEHEDKRTRRRDRRRIEGGVMMMWGGLMGAFREPAPSTGQTDEESLMPVCKHLLACVLAECWDDAARLVQHRRVCREEWVAWAAGWGG